MKRFSSIALCAAMFMACLPALAQVPLPDNGDSADTPGVLTGIGRNARASIRGTVRDAATGESLVDVTVELTSLSGAIRTQTVTNNNGNFGFDGIPPGTYTVEVDEGGYQHYRETLDLTNGPSLDINALLKKIGGNASAPPTSQSTVSARQLAIPGKAQESMEKGLRLLYMKNDLKGAIREFQQAIQAYPTFYEAYAAMGEAYMDMKDASHAQEAFQKSLDLSDQKYPQAYVNMAKLLSDGHHYADAEPLARKAVDLDPSLWQADAELARAQSGEEKFVDAEKSVSTAVKIAPREPVNYLLRININLKLQNYPVVLQDAETYLRLVPTGNAADQVRIIQGKVKNVLASIQSSPSQPQATTEDRPSLSR